MFNKPVLRGEKTTFYADLIFVSLIFSLPLIGKIGLKISNIDIKVYFVLIIAIWALFKVLFSKVIVKKITLFDIGTIIFVLYFIAHFILYSEASFYYFKLWLYSGYIVVFFIFKWALSVKNTSDLFVKYIFHIVVIIGLFQSFVALLQYFKILEVKSKFFTLLGSFTSPNFLGAYLGLSLVILLWLLFIEKNNRKVIITSKILIIFFFLCLIILSKSRATWLATISSLIALIITSKRVRFFLEKVTPNKKLAVGLAVIVIILFSSKFLYDLKPESVKGRFFVAKTSLQEIAKQPIVGYGVFSFPGKYNQAKASYFELGNTTWEETKAGTYIFTPFNDYILIAFELGCIGLILVLTFILFIIIKSRINKKTRLGLALFVNVCILAFFSSPLSNILLMSVALFSLALVLKHGGFNKNYKIDIPIYIPKLLILATCITGIHLTLFKLYNQPKFKSYSIEKGSLEKFINLSSAIEDNMFSGLSIGKKLYESGYQNEGKNHIDRAFKKSSAPRIGRVLAYLNIKENNFKKAEEIFKFNINVEPYRYEPRMDLISLYEKNNYYDKVIDLSKEIINLPVKIPSKKVDNYKKLASKKLNNYKRLAKIDDELFGSLSISKIINSKILNKKLPFKVYLPPIQKIEKELPVIYINDGYNYIRKGNIHKTLDSLITNKIIEPVAAVFLDPRDKNENWKKVRQELFFCNPLFGDFFTDELIPQIEKSYPVGSKRENRSILGVSFGGLAALYLADKAPHSFKNIAMQSPAFHPCPDIYVNYKTRPKKDLKIFMSYGTGQDTSKQDIPMINILKKRGYNLNVNVVEGGNHSWNVWKKQLSDILIYFYKI